MKKAMKKINKRSNKPLQQDAMNFTAVDMLHDPQDFAEKLFKQLDKISGDFELRLGTVSFPVLSGVKSPLIYH